LSLLASLLILFVTYAYFAEVLPALIEHHGTLRAELITLLGIWILGNLMFNYLSTMWIGPGSPPDHLNEEQKANLIDDPELDEGHSYRYCKKCNKVKPMRTHHCSVCNTCVLKMDHHCPWVNNCVGHRNHKHFLLFLFYMWAGSAFFIFSSFESTVKVFTTRYTFSTLYLVSAVLCFSAFIATSLFLGWNLFLLATNQSTIEFYGNYFGRNRARGNPFNAGFTKNMEAVFGKGVTIWSWCLPSRGPPDGDGITFPMNPDYTSAALNKFVNSTSGYLHHRERGNGFRDDDVTLAL
jgi:palmitoyltransferase